MKLLNQLTPATHLPVTWTDEDWSLSLNVRGIGARATRRRRNDKPACRGHSRAPHRRAFTLIEMLVVIAIIAILASLLIPVVAKMKGEGRKKMVGADMSNLAMAIAAYQQDYTIAPVSTNTANAAAATPEAQLSFTNGNAEIMIILQALDAAPNAGHLRNPQKRNYVSSFRRAANDTAPGIDSQQHFRDAWGTPYIVSMDLNFDNFVDDPVYGRVPGAVLIWSAGPDRKFAVPANPSINPDSLPENKDNLKHWK